MSMKVAALRRNSRRKQQMVDGATRKCTRRIADDWHTDLQLRVADDWHTGFQAHAADDWYTGFQPRVEPKGPPTSGVLAECRIRGLVS